MHWIVFAGRILHRNIDWMAWNLFLAFIPLLLSVWLFRYDRSRSLLWWVGCLVFVAFLPNAPYVLTDIIHLIDDIRQYESVWVITLLLIPQYLMFILAGFQAYVFSLMNLGRFLKEQRQGKWILTAELVLHGLSASGVYLGRFNRLNSWNIVTNPIGVLTRTVTNLTSERAVAVMAVTFVLLTVMYWMTKQVNLSLLLRSHYIRTVRQGQLTSNLPQSW